MAQATKSQTVKLPNGAEVLVEQRDGQSSSELKVIGPTEVVEWLMDEVTAQVQVKFGG